MQAKHHIDIAAPPDHVWAVLTDFAGWPRWQKAISHARLDGPVAVGSILHWKAGGVTIRSELADVAQPYRLRWKGRSFAGSADHLWLLERHGAGTRVTSEETMQGWLVALIGLVQPHFLDRILAAALADLKAAAEAPSA